MEYLIVAKSRAGWAVALGADVVAEFADHAAAQAHAEEMAEGMQAAGRAVEIIDLAEAETGASLMRREG